MPPPLGPGQRGPHGLQSPVGSSPGGYPGSQPMQAPPPQRRLDPDQMPSPVSFHIKTE